MSAGSLRGFSDSSNLGEDIEMGDEPLTLEDEGGYAAAWLSSAAPAIQGNGGRRTTIGAVRRLIRHYMLSRAAALDLLARLFNPRCAPPWEERELAALVEAAWRARCRPANDTGAAPESQPGVEAGTLDTAYRLILAGMPLRLGEESALRARGLTAEEIARAGYRTWETSIDVRKAILARVHEALGDSMYAVPGVYRTAYGPELGLGTAGLTVPVRDVQGRVVGLRVRVVGTDRDGKPTKSYLWLSARKDVEGDAHARAQVHVPLHDPALDLSTVAITEGEIKADIATLRTGVLYLSVPGVSSWRLGLDTARGLGARTILLAYDADHDTNVAVAQAVVYTYDAAMADGLAVALQVWDRSVAKGIDDALVKAPGALRRLDGEEAAVYVGRLARKHDIRRRDAVAESLDAVLDGADVDSAGPAAPTSTTSSDPKATPAKRLPLTDLGNAERMVRLFGENIRYVGAWKKWLIWGGQRWQVDETEQIVRYAQLTARAIYKEASSEEDPDKRRALAVHATKSEATPRVKAMISQACALPGVAIRVADLDKDNWLLNCPNGTLDLRAGVLRPHRREDMITKITSVPYDPGAKAPLWEQFLDRVQPDKGIQNLLGRLSGYSLTGDVGEHVLPVHYGKGRNGKGVFVNAKLDVLGDYATQIPTELLMVKKGEAHPTEKTVLFGMRFAAATESEEGKSLNVALVKQLVGGDRISARKMREDFWQFSPTHKIELSTNHRPVIRETADAIWERVLLIPWDVQIPKAERDKSLGEKLKTEGAGILAWMVRHCLAWQKGGGLMVPECVRAATAKYRESEDLFGMFLSERCVLESKSVVSAAELRQAYKQWAESRDEKGISDRALSAKLEERSFVKGRDKTNCVTWTGLKLAPVVETGRDAEDAEDDGGAGHLRVVVDNTRTPEWADTSIFKAMQEEFNS